MSQKPAYEIPLTEGEFALLGKLVAALGQAEEEMILCTSGLMSADRATTEQVMGSGSMAIKSTIWASFVKLRSEDERIHSWVDYAINEIKVVSAARNSFVHANWMLTFFWGENASSFRQAEDSALEIFEKRGDGMAVARRTQNSKSTKRVTDLPASLEQANRLSQIIAHIGFRMTDDRQDGPSPWLEKLGGQPPQPPEKQAARKAKEQKPPPPTSLG